MAPDDDLTIEAIDEAFAHLSAVPVDERGAAWHAYADELLGKRLALAGTEAQRRVTRPAQVAETR